MQPQSPNPDFNFMFQNNQVGKPNSRLAGLPKPLKIGLLVIVGIIILIVVSSLLSGRNKGSTQPVVGALARAEETLRVTTLVQQLNPQDPQTQALAATINASLTSDQIQLANYLAQNHVKVSKAQLAADTDKTTDASLQSAAQNNNLDSAYVAYLKTALAKYQTDLANAYKAAGPNGKKLLSSSYDSTKALLSVQPLKS